MTAPALYGKSAPSGMTQPANRMGSTKVVGFDSAGAVKTVANSAAPPNVTSGGKC